jgi:NAD(P)-dependent dehydrogenase (short-subunit alcohol dehydrogenase family)
MAGVNLNLDGRVAIVTGAAGIMGMGRAIALALANAGADVAVCDLHIDKGNMYDLEGTANEIRKLGRRSIGVKTDVTQESDVNSLVERVVKELGTVDILVNDAGIGGAAPLLKATSKQWDRVMDVNLKGCFFCCQAVARVMVKQKRGAIVNIASAGGMRGSPPEIPYGISKAGVIHLTRAVAQELVQYGIRANAIAPGITKTDMPINDMVEGGAALSAQMIADIREQAFRGWGKLVPMGRLGEPSDIADVALFLCSDMSRFITGVTIPVDGGLMLGKHDLPDNIPTKE